MKKKALVLLLSAALAAPTIIGAAAQSPDDPVSAVPGTAVVEPVAAVAADAAKPDDELLEDAIKSAKLYIGNTVKFDEVSHQIVDLGGFKVVYLDWSSSESREYASAVVTEDGVLIRCSRHTPGEQPAMPEITKEDALMLAYEFAMKVNPAFGLLSTEHATVKYQRYSGYSVTFYAMHNGCIIDSCYVQVSVNNSGKVTEYDAQEFVRGLKLPAAPESIIPKEDAKKALKTKLAPELIYKSFYRFDDKTGRFKAEIKLVYQLPGDYNYNKKVIDAVTGEVITVNRTTSKYYAAERARSIDGGGYTRSSAINLTPAEQKAVEAQAGLITAAEADAKVRAVSEFGIPNSLPVDTATLSTIKSAYNDKLSYRWAITYRDKEEGKYAYAIVDAKTGEILSFSGYGLGRLEYKPASEFKYTEAECEEAAVKLMQKLYGEKFESYVRTEYQNVRPLSLDDIISTYTFNFVRVINGAKFNDDFITVSVYPDTLAVTDVSFGYTDTEFPSTDGALDVSAAVDAYFGVVENGPYYLVAESNKDGELQVPVYPFTVGEKQLVPVYGYTFYCYVDAMTGELLDYNGEPAEYKPLKFYSSGEWFGDLAGSPYYPAVKILYNMDIVEAKERDFCPNDEITGEELLDMLWKAGYMKPAELGAEPVSLEDAADIIMRAVGYSKILGLSKIFKVPFGGKANLSEDRIAAVALAEGLGLLDGVLPGEDAPDLTAPATRGQAAQLVYNLVVWSESNEEVTGLVKAVPVEP